MAKVINTTRSDLGRRFAMNGLQVRSDALTLLEAEAKHGAPPYESINDFISQLTDVMLMKMSTESMIIDVEFAAKAIEALREHRRLNGNIDTVADAQSAEGQEFIVIRNVTHNQSDPSSNVTNDRISSSPSVSTHTHSHFANHYAQLLNALKKLPAFESGQFRLTSIYELNTYDSSIELNCVVFAMLRKDLSRIMEFLFEDPTGKVPVMFDREETIWREWATFENAIYLAEGSYDAVRDSFLVRSIGLPPPISSMMPSSPIIDRPLLSNNQDSMVIILADCHLDQPKTIEALKFVFTGYSQVEIVPEVFVLMGDFVSQPVDQFELKDHMKTLIKLIGTFKRLANQSRFIFVPGPNDIDGVNRLNKQHQNESVVVNHFTSDHFPTTTTKLRHYFLASNPFHLQVQDRNLCLYHPSNMLQHVTKKVVHSDVVDYQHNSQSDRAKLLFSSRNRESFFGSLGRTMISGAHLTVGTSRSYLDALALFPRFPETILLCDSVTDQATDTPLYDDTIHLVTMRSFSKSGAAGEFQFLCYYPPTNVIEESQVSI